MGKIRRMFVTRRTMSGIRTIEEKLKAIYSHTVQPTLDVPLSLQAAEWAHRAEEFGAAASVVAERLPSNWLPRLQLTGHALEAALKAFLAANEVPSPNTHDLARLFDLSASHGCELDDLGMASVVHASHFYYQDLGTGTKYKARYPTLTTESLGGAVPEDSTFQAAVRSIIEQARRKRPW